MTFSKTVHRLLILSLILFFSAIGFLIWGIFTGIVIAKISFSVLLVLAGVCSVFWLERAEHEKVEIQND